MMARTDRHCRYLLRLVSARTLLYSEMIHANAVVRGDANRLLAFDDAEHPVGLQLGGAEPDALARAAEIGQAFGYDEINLNIGCPSPRVRKGRFGAALMETPDLVAECARAMIRSGRCSGHGQVPHRHRRAWRLRGPQGLRRDRRRRRREELRRARADRRARWPEPGREPRDSAAPLRRGLPPQAGIAGAGGGHQRRCRQPRRGGCSPRSGRRRHDRARGLRRPRHAARRRPPHLRRTGTRAEPSRHDIARAMLPYVRRMCADGVPLHHITRHMLGLFAGQPGGRAWRRALGEASQRPGAGAEVIEEALTLVPERAGRGDAGRRDSERAPSDRALASAS